MDNMLSADRSCPINDLVHGAARGTIGSSMVKRFRFPISLTIASIAARRSSNRAIAGDLRPRSKNYVSGSPSANFSRHVDIARSGNDGIFIIGRENHILREFRKTQINE
jgi:hypothetical protein